MKYFICMAFSALIFCSLTPFHQAFASDPLPSWKEGSTKQTIIKFVSGTTTKTSPSFIKPSERIAVFDNDGTLWAEKPVYFQLYYTFDRIKGLVDKNPQWRTEPPFSFVINGEYEKALAGGKQDLLKLVTASHSSIDVNSFQVNVRQWLIDAKHPSMNKPYTDLVYLPMLELLEYLRSKGYKTYIVSGGGIDFLRVFSEQIYGVPPEQVIGTSLKAEYKIVDGIPTIQKRPQVNFIDDKAGKPVGIQHHIGRKPVIAVGNSDGDYQMLQWTTSQSGPSLGLIVHHTDSKREWAYDRDSHVGKLDKGLEDAEKMGWKLIDMKKDWEKIFK